MRKVDWSKSKIDTNPSEHHRLHRLWIISDNKEGGYPADMPEAAMQLIKLQEHMMEKYNMTDDDWYEIVIAVEERNERSHDYDGDGD